MFEWYDGPLVSSMTCGDHILVDEISLAEDSVLERLNSVLEQERRLNVPDRIVEVFFSSTTKIPIGVLYNLKTVTIC